MTFLINLPPTTDPIAWSPTPSACLHLLPPNPAHYSQMPLHPTPPTPLLPHYSFCPPPPNSPITPTLLPLPTLPTPLLPHYPAPPTSSKPCPLLAHAPPPYRGPSVPIILAKRVAPPGSQREHHGYLCYPLQRSRASLYWTPQNQISRLRKVCFVLNLTLVLFASIGDCMVKIVLTLVNIVVVSEKLAGWKACVGYSFKRKLLSLLIIFICSSRWIWIYYTCTAGIASMLPVSCSDNFNLYYFSNLYFSNLLRALKISKVIF